MLYLWDTRYIRGVSNRVIGHSLFTEFDIYLFKSGKHTKLFEKMGAHALEIDGVQGTYFAVYAPAARSVQVIGNFNGWNGAAYELYVRWDSSGIWEGFIPGIERGELYKYRIYSNYDAIVRDIYLYLIKILLIYLPGGGRLPLDSIRMISKALFLNFSK